MRHLCEWPILAENRWPHIGRKLTPKGFDFGLDERPVTRQRASYTKFPSLKGFDFGLDGWTMAEADGLGVGFHPSKGSTSA